MPSNMEISTNNDDSDDVFIYYPTGEQTDLADYSHLSTFDRMKMLYHFLHHVTIYDEEYVWYINTHIEISYIIALTTQELKSLFSTWNNILTAVDQYNEDSDYQDEISVHIKLTKEKIMIERYSDHTASEIDYELFLNDNTILAQILYIFANSATYNRDIEYPWEF